MNREEIKKLIPHREPMLLVDECEIVDGQAVGKYLVRGDEWFLQGHFPGSPIVPGVILCEIVAQTGSVLVLERPEFMRRTPVFAGISNAKFKRKVLPGEELTVKCSLKRLFGNIGFAQGEAFVDGELAVSVEFSFALI